MPKMLTGEEFYRRFQKNLRITGFGAAVVTHAPCPFCGAPDFQQWHIVSVAEDMEAEATCSECGRSGRTIVGRSYDGSIKGTTAEFVQTAGDPPPSYLIPPPRLVPRGG